VIHVREHPLFVREGNDIVCEVPIAFTQAALGADVEVPTLEGPNKVRVPAGTQSGQLFQLKGRGMPDINGYGRGDQIVRIIVETPRRLSPRQRELLEEFARLSGEEVHPLAKSFLEKVKSMLG
jgi:molecular chaperone DnaJ